MNPTPAPPRPDQPYPNGPQQPPYHVHAQQAYGYVPQQPYGRGLPQPPPFAPRESRLPSVGEGLGWTGGVLTLIGIVAVTIDFWGASLLGGWPLFAILAIATGVLAGAAAQVAGLVDGDRRDRIASALASGLGTMAASAAIWTTYVGTDTAVGGRVWLGVLAASATATAITAVTANRTGHDAWRALTLTTGALTLFAGAALVTDDTVIRSCTIAATGAIGLLAAVTLSPTRTRITQATAVTMMYAGAQTALLIGPTAWAAATIAITSIAVTGIVAAKASRRVAVASGVATLLLTGQVLGEAFPGLLTLSSAILATGIAMTAGCIVIAAKAKKGRTADGG